MLPSEKKKRLLLSEFRPVWHKQFFELPGGPPKSYLLEQLDWPSVRWRRTVAALVFLHKLVYSVSSPCADSLLPFSALKSGRALRKPHQVLLSQPNDSFYRNSFFFYAAALWNTLPDNIQSQKSRKQFKKAVKIYLKSYKYITIKNVPLRTCAKSTSC